jgi:hypothetical protein
MATDARAGIRKTRQSVDVAPAACRTASESFAPAQAHIPLPNRSVRRRAGLAETDGPASGAVRYLHRRITWFGGCARRPVAACCFWSAAWSHGRDPDASRTSIGVVALRQSSPPSWRTPERMRKRTPRRRRVSVRRRHDRGKDGIVFNLNDLSFRAAQARAADLVREAERERRLATVDPPITDQLVCRARVMPPWRIAWPPRPLPLRGRRVRPTPGCV